MSITGEFVDRLIFRGLKVNKTDENGRTALMLAAAARNLDAMHAILNPDVSVITRDVDQKSVLHIFLEAFNKPEDDANKDVAIILKMTLRLSTEMVNWKDAKGVTPIMIAARNKQIDIVRYLIECGGAQLDDGEKTGETILHILCSR